MTFTSINPSTFMLPDKTLSPTFTFCNLDSPVRAAVFNELFPFVTIPSKGIFSPFFTTIISPIFTFSGDTF